MIRPSFRVATADEADYYESRLYPLQDRILAVAGDYGGDLVLTGGTALTRCYFDHRYSEDIDLFTNVARAGELGRDFANALTAIGLKVSPVTVGSTFFRGIVSDGETEIQVDVAPDSPRILLPQQSRFGVLVHSLRDIGSNKISAYEDRAEVKDVIDLYYLARELTWSQMFEDAELKRVPIAYADLQNLLNQPLTGISLIKQPITSDEFDGFLATLRSEIAYEIKKKVSASSQNIPALISSLLWDTPVESRIVSDQTKPVLARRLSRLPLPARLALEHFLSRPDDHVPVGQGNQQRRERHETDRRHANAQRDETANRFEAADDRLSEQRQD